MRCIRGLYRCHMFYPRFIDLSVAKFSTARIAQVLGSKCKQQRSRFPTRRKKMRKLIRLFLIYASVSVLFGSLSAFAQADRSLEGDQKCTLCHNESWGTPILTIYQTKHGVKADGRTPGCQSCHGASSGHLSDPTTKPDVVFGAKSKNLSSAAERNASCLTCHESSVRARSHWAGSAHEMHGLACTDCHELHSPTQKVQNPVTQAEVCAKCHKAEQAQIHRFSRHPILEGKVSCSSCHNVHGSDGPHQGICQRDVLHVPRGEARSLPLGACTRCGRLHQLSHASRFEFIASAEDADADALSELSHRRSRENPV